MIRLPVAQASLVRPSGATRDSTSGARVRPVQPSGATRDSTSGGAGQSRPAVRTHARFAQWWRGSVSSGRPDPRVNRPAVAQASLVRPSGPTRTPQSARTHGPTRPGTPRRSFTRVDHTHAISRQFCCTWLGNSFMVSAWTVREVALRPFLSLLGKSLHRGTTGPQRTPVAGG